MSELVGSELVGSMLELVGFEVRACGFHSELVASITCGSRACWVLARACGLVNSELVCSMSEVVGSIL